MPPVAGNTTTLLELNAFRDALTLAENDLNQDIEGCHSEFSAFIALSETARELRVLHARIATTRRRRMLRFRTEGQWWSVLQEFGAASHAECSLLLVTVLFLVTPWRFPTIIRNNIQQVLAFVES